VSTISSLIARHRSYLLIAGLACLALAAAGCGGSTNAASEASPPPDLAPDTAASPAPDAGPQNRFGAFGNLDMDALSACMEAAGYPLPQGSGPRATGPQDSGPQGPGPRASGPQGSGAQGFRGRGGGIFGSNGDPARAAALADCAARQGVTLPQGGFPGGGPSGAGFGGGNFDAAAVVDCLSNAGIAVPDSARGDGAQAFLRSLDRTDPTIQEDLQACFASGGQ
jgi:hypothetical protein